MKTKILVFLLLAGVAHAAPKHVLFLGNSFTVHNLTDQDVPQAFSNLVVSAGYEAPFVLTNCPGGYTLLSHLNDSTSLALIATGGWDYVVLQEQSMPYGPCAGIDPTYYSFFWQGASGL